MSEKDEDRETEEQAPEEETSAPRSEEEAASEAEPAVESAPTKKKKKKKRPAGEPAVDDPRVREIEAMFVAGDFAKTRELATALLGDGDPRLVDVGRDYLHRTGVDPIQLAFLGACAAALIAIAWIYIPH